MFEIDRFEWRFDILTLRASLRDYCRKHEIWMPSSQAASTMHSSENPLGKGAPTSANSSEHQKRR